MLHGFATPEGTRLFAERFPAATANHFFRDAAGLQISSLGFGTYLGESEGPAGDLADAAYEESANLALRSGINFLDTALSYREQRSERALRAALRTLINANELQRDQIVIATKAGFLTPGAIPESLLPEDIAGGIHSLHPAFIEDQLNRSRENLGLDTLDILYLHNPEFQLQFATLGVVEHRLQLAFEKLEQLAADRVVRAYGLATWDAFRKPEHLDLSRIIDLARYVGGEEHHLRFLQLPFNLGMVEAYIRRDEQGVSVLKVAGRAGITVVASASLHQAGIFPLPAIVRSRIADLSTDAARAIQFTRSTPGISSALVGMSNLDHLRENLEVASTPPLGVPDYEKLYRPI